MCSPSRQRHADASHYDAAPSLFLDYPSYILNPEQIPTGFVDDWSDTYEGVDTVLEVGARVPISISGASGFEDAWTDIYEGALNQSTRFDGHVISLDYRPGEVQLTAATQQEALGRVIVGAEGYPAQTDAQRVDAIALDAQVPIEVEGGIDQNIIAQPEDAARTAWQALQRIARDTGGLLYSTRDGRLKYRQPNSYTPQQVTIDPMHTLVDPLQMSLDISRIANEVAMTYGDRDPDTGKRPQVNSTNQTLVDELESGRRTTRWSWPTRPTRRPGQIGAPALTRAGRWAAWRYFSRVRAKTQPTTWRISGWATWSRCRPCTRRPGADLRRLPPGYTETISRTDWAFTLHPTPWDWSEI